MKKIVAIFVALLSALSLKAESLTGQGATFPLPLYKEWAKIYYTQTKNQVSYSGGGSGKGVAAISARNGDFAGSDAPLNSKELEKANLAQFPATIGSIVLAYNLPGVKDGELRLSHSVLAGIFSGEITSWDDEKIKADNPSLNLAKMPIIPVVRSDSSGTTFNFTSYLSLADKNWATKFGANKTINWAAKVTPAASNPLVAKTIAQNKGAIGYIEYAYKLSSKLNAASLLSVDNEWLEPIPANFAKAVINANLKAENDFESSLVMKPNAYPIVAASFILVPKESKSTKSVGEFFLWAFEDEMAKKAASNLGYEALPDETIKQIKAYLNAIK